MTPNRPAEDLVEALFHQHVNAIYRYCQAQLGEAAGQDVTSQVFMVAWRKANSIPQDKARAWLFGVARRLVANQHRAGKRQRALIEKAKGINAGAPLEGDPAAIVAGADLARRAIAALGARDREVLCLVLAEDLTKAELGQALGISANAAGVRLSRARAHLTKSIEKLEQTETSTLSASKKADP